MEVPDDDDVELCKELVNVTINSESERSVIDPDEQTATIMDFDNEGNMYSLLYEGFVLSCNV